MDEMTPLDLATVPDLTVYLFARRDAVLSNWRGACEQDSGLHTVATLSTEEFNDQVPLLLNILLQRLRGEDEEEDPILVAREHGLHRWHKGYLLLELTREVGHLHQTLAEEIETYRALYSEANTNDLMRAYQEIIWLNKEIVEGSVSQYDELATTAAVSRASTLQAALEQMNELARQRSNLLRTSSHDLRSSFSIIQGAAFQLDMDNQSPEERELLVEMLNRNLTNVQGMLQSLMSLARLDAGQDQPEISEFNAAKLLHGVVDGAQQLAHDRGLTLMATGPDEIVVVSDAVKVQRIAQNLLLNALTYTSSGIVSVSWLREDAHRWTLSVQDSGPGLPDDVVKNVAVFLKPTVDSTKSLEKTTDKRTIDELPMTTPNVAVPSTRRGEGIGLHIVKRLCELLDANIDIETEAGRGTLVRVRFPIQHHQ
ncbi:sensor histidine kinase [Spirosoma pomorum]